VKIKNRVGLFAKRYQPEFVTNLVAPLAGKVLFNAMGRDSAALRASLSVLSKGQKLTVEHFAVDMHEAFISVIKTECPNAEVCVDHFHLVQKVNEAFDKVRRSEFKKAKENKNEFDQNMLEPHRRFILVKREKELSKSEQKLLDKPRLANQSIHTAMLLVEYSFASQMDDIGGLPDFVKKEFEEYLKCGILAHGFLRAKCDSCKHERLLAFSCKRRGFCPSCGAKRMA
jgi:hypothetical protein